MPDNSKLEIIDERGDLLVHSEDIHFKVSAAVMRLASPVWATFRPRTVNNHPPSHIEGRRVLEMPDSDPDAVRLLLLAAHMRFQRMPRQMTVQAIATLAKHCMRYKIIDLVYHYVDDWMKPVVEQDIKNTDIGHRLWIGWVFDRDHELRKVMRYMFSNMSLDEVKDVTDCPWDCKDLVVQTLRKSVKAIRNETHALVDAISGSDGKTCLNTSSTPDVQDECEYNRLAALLVLMKVFNVPEMNISSRPSAIPTSLTFQVIAKAAKLMETRSNRTVGAEPPQNHLKCGGSIADLADKIEQSCNNFEDMENALVRLLARNPIEA